MGATITVAGAVVLAGAVALLSAGPGSGRGHTAALASAAASTQAGQATAASPSLSWGRASTPCTVTDPAIGESSGVTVTKDLLVTHNDSGDAARYFVLDQSCHTLATRTLAGVSAVDVEDVGRGPDPSGRMSLWLADIGDNRMIRPNIALYATPFPASSARGSATVSATTYQLAYPDGAHNAEALVMDPKTGAFGIVTKTVGTAWLYVPAQPLQAGVVTPLRKAVKIPLVAPDGTTGNYVTGGSVSWAGDLVALRTYTRLWVWRLNADDFAAAFAQAPATRQALPVQRQGESVGFAPDGSLWLTSEGRNQPVELLQR